MNRSCERYREWLKDELAGEIDSRRADELEQHCKECPACSQEENELKSTWELLSGLGDEPAPRHFFVYQDLPESPSLKGRVRWLFEGWRPVAGLTGLILVIGLVLTAAQARLEIGPRSVVLSFPGSELREETRRDVLAPALLEAIRLVVQNEAAKQTEGFRKEVAGLLVNDSSAEREALEEVITTVERRLTDRIDERDRNLRAAFEAALADSVELLDAQRRRDLGQVRQVFERFAAYSRYQAGTSSAIIETLTELAENRNSVHGGTK